MRDRIVGWSLRIAGLIGVTLASAVVSLKLLEYMDDAGRAGWPAVPSTNVISIVEATYGGSCRATMPAEKATAIKDGNATAALVKLCDKAIDDCRFAFDVADVGDPLPGCAKDLSISWRCANEDKPRRLTIAPEAHRKPVYISCLAR